MTDRKNKNMQKEHSAKCKEVLKNLTIMDDIFMRNVLKKPECTEYVLQIIMNKKDLRIISQTIQKDYKNLQGRSAILDCVAQDLQKKQYNIEIQQKSEGATPKRARYHSGLLDMNTLKAGQDFEELQESYVIFITNQDVMGENFPVYHASRIVHEVGRELNDGSHILFVNSQIQDDTEIGKLMYDLHCKNPEDMHSEILAKRVYELKESQEEENMSETLKQFYDEAIAEGEENAKRDTAVSLEQMGMPLDKIAQVLKVEKETVQKWIEEAKVSVE